jgi:hypothetical protein
MSCHYFDVFINLNPFTLHLRSIQHHQSITITNNNNTGVRFYSQQSQFFLRSIEFHIVQQFTQLISKLSTNQPATNNCGKYHPTMYNFQKFNLNIITIYN